MSSLTSRQRAHLRSLAHQLKPILQIGREGVTDAVAATIMDALRTRELLKVKVLEAAPAAASEIAGQLSARLPDTHVVQVIGRTVVLYRRHPDTPEIRLPD